MPKNKGLVKGKTKRSPFVTLYALMQCTRDLSPIDCAECLVIVVGKFSQTSTVTRRDARSCTVVVMSKYNHHPFFFPLDSNSASSIASMVVYP
ncbi:hypothetical protein SLE2022_210650 [Rubroshorea leprosula]